MVNFYIVNALGQNLTTSESCPKYSEIVVRDQISGNLSKNGYV
jgi:hypothetical protein